MREGMHEVIGVRNQGSVVEGRGNVCDAVMLQWLG